MLCIHGRLKRKGYIPLVPLCWIASAHDTVKVQWMHRDKRNLGLTVPDYTVDKSQGLIYVWLCVWGGGRLYCYHQKIFQSDESVKNFHNGPFHINLSCLIRIVIEGSSLWISQLWKIKYSRPGSRAMEEAPYLYIHHPGILSLTSLCWPERWLIDFVISASLISLWKRQELL